MNWLNTIAQAGIKIDQKVKDNIPNTDGEFRIEWVLTAAEAMAGLVAVGFIIYGAFQFLTAHGDAGRVKTALMTLTYALVGLGVVLAASAITWFIFSNAR